MIAPDVRRALAMSAPERYRYFLSHAPQTRRVWGLGDENGWLAVRDASGCEWFPIWSKRDLAEACTRGRWRHCTPSEIGIKDFVRRWLPVAIQRRQGFLVFPTPASAGIGISGHEMHLALRAHYQSLRSGR